MTYSNNRVATLEAAVAGQHTEIALLLAEMGKLRAELEDMSAEMDMLLAEREAFNKGKEEELCSETERLARPLPPLPPLWGDVAELGTLRRRQVSWIHEYLAKTWPKHELD